jgi:hypothetical protein
VSGKMPHTHTHTYVVVDVAVVAAAVLRHNQGYYIFHKSYGFYKKFSLKVLRFSFHFTLDRRNFCENILKNHY